MTTIQVAIALSAGALLVAVYGAMIAHLALRRQKKGDARRRQQEVRIHFEHAARRKIADPQTVWIVGGEDNLPLEYRLRVVIVNASEEATIYVRRLRVQEAYGDGRVNFAIDESDAPLAPRQSMVRQLNLHNVDIDLTDGLVAKLGIAPNLWFTSEVEPLDSELLRHIEDHNERVRLTYHLPSSLRPTAGNSSERDPNGATTLLALDQAVGSHRSPAGTDGSARPPRGDGRQPGP